MKIGHIFLAAADAAASAAFARLVEGLDHLAIDQHVLASDIAICRRLESRPYVTVGPVVKSPVMAYCLMPNVDLAHAHDEKGSQAGLLLTLTRSIPFVMPASTCAGRQPLQRSIRGRALRLIEPGELVPDRLIEIYRQTLAAWSELPQDANCG